MEEYLDAMEGRSEHTRAAYRRDLERMELHFGKEKLPLVTASELKTYFSLLARSASASSLSRALSAARGYFCFLKRKRGLEINPMDGVSVRDFAPQAMPMIDGDDFEKLMRLSVFGIRGKRDQAMIALLCETGIRVSELVGMDREDFDSASCRVRCGTGKKRRFLSVSSDTCLLLERYLSLARLQAPEEQAFFLGSTNRRLTRQGFWKILKEHGERMGIVDCTPQVLRQSFAKRLLRLGESRGQVKTLLGNGSDAALRHYEKEVKEEV